MANLPPIIRLSNDNIVTLRGGLPRFRQFVLPGSGTRSMGINLGTLLDYIQPRLIDKAKQSRKWIDLSFNVLQAPYVNADGHLVSLPSGVTQVALILYADLTSQIGGPSAGRYRVWWDGTATVSENGMSNRTNLDSNSFEVDIPFVGTGSFVFNCTNPSDLPRNVCCVRTDHLAAHTAGQIFLDEELAAYSQAGCLRFMDWMITNASPVVEWADYPSTTAQNFGRVPFSAMVGFANTLSCDPWFCVPHQASDDFVTQMATYLRDNVNTDLKIRIEYSNEVWNFIFAQTFWIRDQALADWGNSEAWMSWAGKRLYEISVIFNTVFAGQTDRLVFVVGGFSAIADFADQFATARDWQTYDSSNYVNPVSNFHEIALNPYFGTSIPSDHGAAIMTALSTSVEAAVTEMNSYVPAAVSSALSGSAANKVVADNRGLALCVYEYNQHIDSVAANINGSPMANGSGWISEDVETVVNTVCAGPAVLAGHDTIRAWFRDNGGTYVCFFSDVGPWGRFGQWGAEQYRGENSAVWTALKDWHNANPKWW